MSADLVTDTRALLQLTREAGVLARALGGVAVALRCPVAGQPPLAREYHDMDLATDQAHAHRLSQTLVESGFAAADRFNALHGHSRMMFSGPGEIHVDVIVGEFVMCHRLDLRHRLTVHYETLGLADLLLTKLQIAKINHKDVVDTVALFIDHNLGDSEEGINAPYLVKLLSMDWGWWRTVTANLEIVDELVPTLGLSLDLADRVHERIGDLRQAIRGGKRSVRWKARARIGERMTWRFDPEEVTP